MKKNYSLILIALLCAVTFGYGQVTIAVQDFETVPATPTLNYSFNTGSFDSASGNSGSGDRPQNSPQFTSSNTSWRIANTNVDADFGPIDITSYQSVQVEFNLAGFSIGSTFNGLDGSDYIDVYVSLDNGVTWSYEMEITGNSNARWAFNSGSNRTITYDGDNTPDSYSSTNANPIDNVIINIPDADAATASNFLVGFVVLNNSPNESWNIDDIEVSGISSAPCVPPSSQPTSLLLNNITGVSIDGSFTSTTADEYLVVVSTSATLGANPVNGTSYANGASIGSGTVIQSSNATTFTATGLSQTTQYYFFVFALNDSSCSGGPDYNTTNPLTGNATTITGPCLTTGFENSDGWSDHAYGNWTETDVNGEVWTGNSIFAGNTGNRRIQMNDVGDWLELPPVDNPSSMEYYARLSSSPSGNNRIMVQYFNGSTWIDIVEHTATTTTYQLFTADLSSITALTNVRLRLRRSADNRVHYIDDLSVYCGSSTPIAELQLVDNMATNQNCGYIIDFGNVANDGSTSDLTFDIENIGSVDLNVSSFNITGDYSIISPATPFVVTSGNSQTVTVRFAPTTDGTLVGVLTINNDDLDESSCIVNLTGVGFTAGPNINVRGVVGSNPTIANGSTTTSFLNNTRFAQQTISTTQQIKTFRIGNEGGTAPLTVSGITLTGDTADFFVTSSFTNPFPINTSQDFTITFQPTTLSGLRTATVSIANSDPNKDPYTFVVEGNAICPSVTGTISPTDGPAGTTVSILSPGNDLTGATAELNGVPLTPVSSDNLELIVRLPNTITTGGSLSVQLTNGCIFSNTFNLLDQTIAGCDTSSSATVGNLFISEVTDSPSGSLTYVELYNATGATINFATDVHRFRIYNNGNTSTTYELVINSGTVANNNTFTISCGVTANQCPITGGDGSLAQANLSAVGASINFFRNSSGVDDPTIGHDYIGIYADSEITPMNPDGNIDSWGVFGDQTWATGLGLGLKGANFQRDTSAPMIPNTTFSVTDWVITDWNDADCSDVDYSTIGIYDFSTGVAPSITTQPSDPAFACAFSASLTITGTEGYNGPTPPDTQELAYQWYFNTPGSAIWTEILPTNTDYTGQQSATLNIIDTFNLDGYQYYCQLREDSSTCFEASNAVVLDVRKSEWDGTSWSETPAIDRVVIIDGDYDTSTGGSETSFEACDCTVNNGNLLTIANNTYVLVENDLTVDGNMVVQTNGSFVQINDAAVVDGAVLTDKTKISVEKQTSSLASSFEYTYWSSPVSGEIISDGLSDAYVNRIFSFNGQNFRDTTRETNNDNTTVLGQDDIDDDGNDWQFVTGSSSMIPGVGYASTHNILGPFPNQFTYTFEGAFNNGVYNIPIYRDDAELNDNNWNFIGNPYPSAIDADLFLAANASIDQTAGAGATNGAIFFWSHNTVADDNTNGNEDFNYAQSDYAIINGSGQIMGGDGVMPTRHIPSGQGFFVSMDDAAPSIPAGSTLRTTDIVFNNSMRVTGNNNQFFRNPVEANRLWLNLTSDNGVFNQVLIAYVDGATNDDDGMYYDASKNLSSELYSGIYSLINGSNNKKFAIQGKDPNSLTIDEVISLGFNTVIDEPTIYTISIYEYEGIFMDGNDIFIIDYLLNTIHNLKDSDYSFTSETGEFNDRFEIVFTADALSVDENLIDSNDITIIELTNGDVKFNVGNSLIIDTVEILDVLGRTIYNLQGNSSSEIYNLSKLSNAAYIAKVTLSNGQVISKKAIKR